MSDVRTREVSKSYGAAAVLDRITLEIHSGEFIVLVGPSGCGKSTLLRIIAGLDAATEGDVFIGDRRVNMLPPVERGIGMVFQDYALYPHMNVYENLLFGLRLRRKATGLSPEEIRQRVDEVATMLGLKPLLERKPAQLSGGQRQRVAIGRALVKHPRVLLLDEPLSNLDARLRTQTRVDIARLHRTIRATTIYVTHDQEEAMTLADRIVVLNQGRVQQVGAPMEVYQRPKNRFVASFIGTPPMNFLPGTLEKRGGETSFSSAGQRLLLAQGMAPEIPGHCVLGFRAEAIALNQPGLLGSFVWLEHLGHEVQAIARLGDQQLTLRTSNREEIQFLESLQSGQEIKIGLNQNGLHWFDDQGERMDL